MEILFENLKHQANTGQYGFSGILVQNCLNFHNIIFSGEFIGIHAFYCLIYPKKRQNRRFLRSKPLGSFQYFRWLLHGLKLISCKKRMKIGEPTCGSLPIGTGIFFQKMRKNMCDLPVRNLHAPL